ncbi:MAG TPA: RodZ domain-containing protein [Gaiellaceae bacterium]|nr:RodZ domain-containing protein [Gaiellaceae bacterium]
MFEIGGSLREARLKRGLTPADVQKAIRIRDRYLQALEEERWELLPGDAYVKGFLRTYADYLGLDGNLYVDEYNNRFAQHEELPFVPERFARARSGSGATGRLRPVVVVGVIAAIVIAVATWRLVGSSGNNKQGTPPVSTPTTTSTQTTPRKSKKKHLHHVTVALPTHATLVASRGNCWLWLRSGSSTGRTLYEATLAQGKSLPVDLKNGPVWIEVGDPPSLDVRLGGKLASGLSNRPGATVLLTRSGLKPA